MLTPKWDIYITPTKAQGWHPREDENAEKARGRGGVLRREVSAGRALAPQSQCWWLCAQDRHGSGNMVEKKRTCVSKEEIIECLGG